MLCLENDKISVKIKKMGAELCSLYNKEAGLEYMWQAGEVWPKNAPVLFPIVGVVKNDRYTHKGKEYSLPRHGFTRESLFEARQVSQTEAVFSLASNNSTRAVYPFDFLLEITYRIEDKTLYFSHRVLNTGEETLLYSFGMHPAFTLCFDPSQGADTLSLSLEKDEPWLSTAGLNPDSTHFPREKSLGVRTLQLTNDIFNEDALIFENLQSRALILKSSKNPHTLHFSWSNNMPILGIWSKPKAPFVCIEPWAGICDPQNTDGELAHKKAILSLKKGAAEIFTAAASIN